MVLFSSVCVKIIDQGFGIYIPVLHAQEEAGSGRSASIYGHHISLFVYFRYVSSEATTQTTTKASRFNKYFNCNSEKQTQHQPPPNKLKQIPQRHDLRNFRLLICLERT